MSRCVYDSSFKYGVQLNDPVTEAITAAFRILEKVDEDTLLVECYDFTDIMLQDVAESKDPPDLQYAFELDLDYENRRYYFFKTRQAFIGYCLRGKKNQ